ncbi:HAMP domain-containing sensor histidine kinase [Oribacterium sp. WCC10]|uniref:HAMP domain-containing sensor histidine kinase n=1 Tax=Oribacterium sp. WCC10 TaxID=1855343 RepID=UPI0008F26BF9|nr:HAMP domain-containing sensor histidine kinase [Oribacterium sp. WCC10]SFG15742.1 Signal transduction histidine kinase [Oribacterium sp. WCC10]
MKKSLFTKFIIAYIIFGVLGFAVVALLSSRLTYRYLLQERANSLYSEATLIATTYSETRHTSLSEEVVNEQMNAVSTFLHVDIWIVDRNGYILSDAAGASHKGQSIEAFDTTRTGSRYEVGTYHDMFPSDVLTVMAPVTRDYNTIGYVIIHNSVQNILSSQYEILNIVYVTALIIFLLSLVILIVFYIIVYRPLKKITIGATKYAAGDYAYKIETGALDEMGYLAETLNFMSDEISKADDYQKQFIANVSHDFRSPLTSIKGYLEAILDGTVPKELEEKYLRRLISETERLTKLTQSMLSLGSLDKKGFLSRTNFDINRVIRDVCASFEMTCQKKEIVFELTFAEKKEMVFADYSKIQQVLYNLIDNALKFSNPKSSIRIKTGIRGNKVFISVKDTGIGIPKSDLGKIWDRFYKADQSRGKDRHGTGLGLSIVKSIINAHGENIDCISTEGVGTEFIFALMPAYYPDQKTDE